MPVDALKNEFDYFSPKGVCQLRSSSYPRISVLTHDGVVLTPSEARLPTRSVLTPGIAGPTPSEAGLTHALVYFTAVFRLKGFYQFWLRD